MRNNDWDKRKKYFEKPSFMEIIGESLENRIASPLFKAHVQLIGLNGNERVLDFGCGGGKCARHIVKMLSKGGFLTCIDTSQFWLSRAQKRMKKYANVEFKLGEIQKLDIEDKSYDIIFVHFVLHDIERDLRQITVNALAKKLKPDGVLFIIEPTKECHGISAQEIQDFMTDAGLREKAHKMLKSIITGLMYQGSFINAI